KCGNGRLAQIHHGSWQGLERWAEAQGLPVEKAVRQYHQRTYRPSQLTVAVVDPRPLSVIESAVAPALQYLSPAAAEAAAGTGALAALAAAAAAAAVAPREDDAAAAAAAAEPPSSCPTPAVHLLECASDQQNLIAFFCFFLPPAAPAAAAGAAAAADVAAVLRARRLLVEMLAAPGGDSLLGRLVKTGKAVRAAVHLPVSSDAGGLLQ
ncbi:hypothetical protein, conserved, partial [Eimeria tenella]